MTENKRPDFEFNLEAATELDAQAKRAGLKTIRNWLQQLAERLASNDSGRGDELRDVVEPKHVLLAAERLFASDPTWMVLLDPGQGIFLSYSTKDEDFARELEAVLVDDQCATRLPRGFLMNGSACSSANARPSRSLASSVMAQTTGRLNHFGASSSTSTPDSARSGICLSLLVT